VDIGENFIEAVIHESKEELNIDIKEEDLKLFCVSNKYLGDKE
jgi:ADP-ribose pyrophosphatase YjhB (NUDIX family)